MHPFHSPIDRSDSRNDSMSRRSWLTSMVCQGAIVGAGAMLAPLSGCVPQSTNKGSRPPDLIIGQRGLADGRFQKPRAIAIDANDVIYVCDKTGRIQSFDDHGKFIRGWRTPAIENGKPTGISIDPLDGSVMVADTHYYRYLFYSSSGELDESKTIGGANGQAPNEFAFVTDIVRAPNGELILGEYGEFDTIIKYTKDRKFVRRFGEHGDSNLQFNRPQSLAFDSDGLLWLADSCNHRIQVIDWRGEEPLWIATLGEQGTEPGQFKYPYSLCLFGSDKLIVSEYGNHRVQLLKRDGTSIASWGTAGSNPGQLNQPWATAVDSKSRVYVVDSGNNRVQRFTF